METRKTAWAMLAALFIAGNRDAIGAIAGLLGAMGVIASLVYLALQVRASTAKIREITPPRSSPQIQ
jgi:hypothetical protein